MDPVSVGWLAGLAGLAVSSAGRSGLGWAGCPGAPAVWPGGNGGEQSLAPGMVSGEFAELTQAPADEQRAAALSAVLAQRAAVDAEFGAELEAWRRQAAQVRPGDAAHNRISGGTFNGPVLLGRDFSDISFSASPATLPCRCGPPAPGTTLAS